MYAGRRLIVNCAAIHLGEPSIAGLPSPKNDPPDRFIGFTPAELLTPGSFAVCGRRPEAPRLWTHRKLLKKFDQNFYFGFAAGVYIVMPYFFRLMWAFLPSS